MNCVTQKVFDLSTYFMLQRMAAQLSSSTLWPRLCSGARSGKIFLTMILIIANPQVGDGTDGKLVHLDGLNFSRAWGLYRIADRLGGEEGERFSRFSDIIFSWFLSFDLKVEIDGPHPREGKLWPCGREQLHGFSLVSISKEELVEDFKEIVLQIFLLICSGWPPFYFTLWSREPEMKSSLRHIILYSSTCYMCFFYV